MKLRQWEAEGANVDLSALLQATETEGPQTITRRGQIVAVVLSADAYEQLQDAGGARRGTLLDFFAASPSLELQERDHNDVIREVDL